MNCARLSQVLDAWLDGELDSATGAEIEQHLRGCAALHWSCATRALRSPGGCAT